MLHFDDLMRITLIKKFIPPDKAIFTILVSTILIAVKLGWSITKCIFKFSCKIETAVAVCVFADFDGVSRKRKEKQTKKGLKKPTKEATGTMTDECIATINITTLKSAVATDRPDAFASENENAIGGNGG